MGEAQLFSRLVDTLKAYAGCSPFEATYSASGSSRSARMLFAVSAKKLNGRLANYVVDSGGNGKMKFSATYSRPQSITYRLQYRRASAVLQPVSDALGPAVCCRKLHLAISP